MQEQIAISEQEQKKPNFLRIGREAIDYAPHYEVEKYKSHAD